jgi:cytochrome c oxidase cbb3-type subunit 3
MRWAPALALFLLTASACEREKRDFRTPPAEEAAPGSQAGRAVVVPVKTGGDYERSAYDISEGKQLFSWFNCVGCHANGGGGTGPALMDDKWIYGSSIDAIAASISEGRPKGMPSFRAKATQDQIWKLAAYVRSLAAQVSSDAAPGRNDDMHPHEPESRLPETHPTGGNVISVKP